MSLGNRVKAHPQQAHSNWKPGVIVDRVAPRSYIVEVDGRKYRSHRAYLRDTIQSSQSEKNAQGLWLNKPVAPR